MLLLPDAVGPDWNPKRVFVWPAGTVYSPVWPTQPAGRASVKVVVRFGAPLAGPMFTLIVSPVAPAPRARCASDHTSFWPGTVSTTW